MNKDKLRYAILKEIEKNDKDVDYQTIKIDPLLFGKEANFLLDSGYVKNALFLEGRQFVIFRNGYSVLTEKGEQYLKDNSLLGKSYKIAKEIKDWIK